MPELQSSELCIIAPSEERNESLFSFCPNDGATQCLNPRHAVGSSILLTEFTADLRLDILARFAVCLV
jgi:hypothetical protein